MLLSNIYKSNFDMHKIKCVDTNVVNEMINSNETQSLLININSKWKHSYLLKPSTNANGHNKIKMLQNYIVNKNDEFTSYIINLTKAPIFPIMVKQKHNFINELSKHIELGGEIFMFISLRKVGEFDNWWKYSPEQYHSFLVGVNNPSKISYIRNLQNRLLLLLNRISSIKTNQPYNEDIENKIINENSCYFRIICISSVPNIEDLLYSTFNQYEFMNCFSINKVDNQKILNKILLNPNRVKSKNIINSYKIRHLLTNQDNYEHNNSKQEINDVNKVVVLPQKDRNKTTVRESSEINIIEALYRTNAVSKSVKNIEILEHVSGVNLNRITLTIPDKTNFTDIQKKCKDISAFIGKDIDIIKGDKPNTISFLVAKSSREIVYLGDMINQEDFVKFKNENHLPFICGVDIYDNNIYKCLTNAPHLLIAGSTNSGKSVFLNSLLTTLIVTKKHTDVNLILIDPKRVEFNIYEGIPHVKKIVTDNNEALNVLKELVKEMDRRYELLQKYKFKDVKTFNKNNQNKMPYIVCAIDEYNDLKTNNNEIEKYIELIGQKSRASGIHLIICTQRPDRNVMSGVIKTNLPSRISFKLEGSEYITVFGKGIPYNLLGYGDGVVKYTGQSHEFIRFQSPIISTDNEEESKVYEELRNIRNEDNTYFDNLNKMKEIIISTGETRTKQLQRMMEIRNNDIIKLRRQLVEEGFLIKDGRKYKINNSDTL